jgi:hypothetical protein
MQVKLSRHARRLIRERAAKLGISLSEYIERAVLAANL